MTSHSSADHHDIQVMNSIVRDLKAVAQPGTCQVNVADFQEALAHHGIEKGTALSDAILLNCQLNEENCSVNFSQLESIVSTHQTNDAECTRDNKQIAVVQEPMAPPLPPPPTTTQSSSTGHAKRPQLDLNHVGSNNNDFTNAVAKKLDKVEIQSVRENVQKNSATDKSTQLRELFNQYDTGRLSINSFHDGIRQLGFRDTQALKSLVRHNAYDMTYSSLVRALSATDNGVNMETKVAGDVQFKSPLSIFHEPMTPAAAAKSRASNLESTLDANDVVSWRSSRTNHIPNSPGPVGDLNNPNSAAFQMRRASYDANLAFESEAARMLSPRSRLQTSFFELGRRPSRPTNQPETIRDIVYKGIRHLDIGSISAVEFRTILKDAGIPIPPAMETLLMRHAANGSANFHDFVRVLDPFLPAVQQTPLAQENIVEVTTNIPEKEVPMAQQTHGDVISWRNGPSNLEELETDMAVRGRRHIETNRKTEHLRLGAVDLLSWNSDNANRNNGHKEMQGKRIYHSNAGLHHPSSSFEWFQGNGSSSTKHDSQQPMKGIRTSSAHSTTRIPFGTELDMGPQAIEPQIKNKTTHWTPVPFGTEVDM